MSPRTMYFIGGAAAAIILFWLLPNFLATLIILGLIAIPVVGYFMLDPSQRRRLRGQTRKRLG
jgi:membrane protein implicated in regulation of membrane protease activity